MTIRKFHSDMGISRADFLKMQTRLQPSQPVEREKDLHGFIADYCRSQGWYFVHSRMDKRQTAGIGTPDFVIATRKGDYYIEVKRKGGKPTREQMAVGIMLQHLGRNYALVDSLAAFLEVVK